MPTIEQPSPDAAIQQSVLGNSASDAARSPRSQPTRVCDECIRKKVKCDLGRPRCSRCINRGYTCTYSSVRRKPGPARGSHRGTHRGTHRGPSRSTRSQRSHDDLIVQRQSTNPESPDQLGLSAASQASISSRGIVAHEPHVSATSEPSRHSTTRTEYATQDSILQEEKTYLLQKYLDVLHNACPLFSRARFFSSLGSSQHSRDLISTLVLITAKLTNFKFASDSFDLDTHIDFMVSAVSLQEDMFNDAPPLDQFRKACLLAFYEFHQFPGQQAWMRISKLIRMAYWIGLDRLENLPTLDPRWAVMTEDDLEDWRLVWWFIYRLDSYVNLAAGTPYLIDERLVDTAILRDRDLNYSPDIHEGDLKQKLYLPSRPDDLSKLIPAITSDPYWSSALNLHIVTSTATRQVGRALQLQMLRRQENTTSCLTELERRLSALRLALPANYLNPIRNSFSHETSADHHARLVSILHMLVSRLLSSILGCACQADGDEWLLSWQRVLETCQDMAAVSEQWDGSFILGVDPAVCFIIFTALVFVDLHKRTAAAVDLSIPSGIERCESALFLLLERFAVIWTLPSLLILSFRSFREKHIEAMSFQHIHTILAHFEAPLHPRWLQFLSSEHV